MEAPKCKLCGDRHYGLCSKGGDATAQRKPQLENAPVVSVKPAAGAKPKYDRNAAHRAYMKKYMRKRRAKEKAE